MALSGQLRALSVLGFEATVLHPVRRWLHPRGERAFLEAYGPDRLVPLLEAERARWPVYQRCVACGLCDLVCPLPGRLPPVDFPGPSVVALAWTRSTDEIEAVAPVLEALPGACGDCRACEHACPQRLPLRELFETGNRLLAAVRAAPGRRA